MKTFSIYGDNIVECERMLALVKRALAVMSCKITGSVTAPTFMLDSKNGEYRFNFYPGESDGQTLCPCPLTHY